ncbi:hypothetical protein ACSBR2_013655 [Camellia fascicularis]
MEQIFKGTKEFKKEVFDKVQPELDQFGLHIYNANVKQLDDVRGHEYVADGELYLKKKEAEGIAAVAEAQGFYLRNLLKEANGNYAAVRDYMMINSGMFQEIAKINAQAVHGLQPKISVRSGANNGGGEGGAGGGGMKDVAGVYSMLPPLFQTVHEQTGMLWLSTLPSSS